MVANSALGMMSLALSVMRELGVRRMSNGVCLPSGETKRKCATVDTAFGFCSANHTSNGVRVLPSAKYHLRDSFGNGCGGGISAVGGRLGWVVTLSEVRGGTPRRELATAWATFRMRET